MGKWTKKIALLAVSIFICAFMGTRVYAADVDMLETNAINLSMDEKKSGIVTNEKSELVYKITTPVSETSVEYNCAAVTDGSLELCLYDAEGELVDKNETAYGIKNIVLEEELEGDQVYYLVARGRSIDVANNVQVMWTAKRSIISMEIKNYPKEVYYKNVDKEMSYIGLSVDVAYSDNREETLSYEDMSMMGYQLTASSSLSFDSAVVGKIYGVTVALKDTSCTYKVRMEEFPVDSVKGINDGIPYVVSAHNSMDPQIFSFQTNSCRYVGIKGTGNVSYYIYKKDADGTPGELCDIWAAEASNQTREFYYDADGEFYLFVYPNDKEPKSYEVCVSLHKWDDGTVTVAPTCTSPGKKVFKCTQSGCSETREEIISATGHTVGGWETSVKAGCTTEGLKIQKCTVCNNVINQEKISATGHQLGEWIVTEQPDIFKEGKQIRKCNNCTYAESQTLNKQKAVVTLNATSVPLQLKKSTTAIKIKTKIDTDKVVRWTSSNTKILTVNAKTGKITAKKTGNAYVIVTMKSGATAKCKVKVQKSAVKTTKLTVNKSKVTLVLTGKNKVKTFTIKATKSPMTSLEKVTYKSSNTKVVSVSKTGKITAKKAGKATITVKAGKKTKKITVTVKKK